MSNKLLFLHISHYHSKVNEIKVAHKQPEMGGKHVFKRWETHEVLQ